MSHLSAAFAGGLLVLAPLSATAQTTAAREAAAQARFDGPWTWTVQMVKDSGLCEQSFRYAIQIQGGAITYKPDPGDKPMNFSGSVAPEGAVRIAASRGPAQVSATGSLQSAGGSGTWSLPLLGCQGRWTARRNGVQTTAR
jgi:hypothetical protein